MDSDDSQTIESPGGGFGVPEPVMLAAPPAPPTPVEPPPPLQMAIDVKSLVTVLPPEKHPPKRVGWVRPKPTTAELEKNDLIFGGLKAAEARKRDTDLMQKDAALFRANVDKLLATQESALAGLRLEALFVEPPADKLPYVHVTAFNRKRLGQLMNDPMGMEMLRRRQ